MSLSSLDLSIIVALSQTKIGFEKSHIMLGVIVGKLISQTIITIKTFVLTMCPKHFSLKSN